MRQRHSHIKSRLRHLKPKKNLLKRPLFWIALLVAAMSVGIFYLFFFFPPFQVQTISISGNEKITSQDIEAIAWQNVDKNLLGLGHKSMFTVNTVALRENLLARFPGLGEVNVTKRWLKDLGINISERQAAAIFCEGDSTQNCFVIDKNGVIFEPAYSTAGNLIVRQTVAGAKLSIGQTLVDKDMMASINRLKDALKNNFQIELRQALAANPLVITTHEGWQIHFDPEQDIGAQLTKLDLLLKNEITPTTRENLDYIYLQYKDRAYYH